MYLICFTQLSVVKKVSNDESNLPQKQPLANTTLAKLAVTEPLPVRFQL